MGSNPSPCSQQDRLNTTIREGIQQPLKIGVGQRTDPAAQKCKELTIAGNYVNLMVSSPSSDRYNEQAIISQRRSKGSFMKYPWSVEPIFLHGLWRTASTYFWHKLRSVSDMLCYYEPFHENLSLPPERIFASRPSSSKMRHPEMDGHYFDGFPFSDNKPLEFYKQEFAYDLYHLRSDDPAEDLYLYIRALIGNARIQQKIPAFQFNRSALRIGWMKQRFSGSHVYLLRDPLQMWRSYKTFENYYFQAVTLMAAEASLRQPFLYPLRNLEEGLPRFREDTIHKSIQRYMEYAQSASESMMFECFYRLWLAGLVEALRSADLIIDVSALDDENVRDLAQKRLNEVMESHLEDHPVSLDDFRSVDALPDFISSRDLSKVAQPVLKRIQAKLPPDVESNPDVVSELLSPNNQKLFEQLVKQSRAFKPGQANGEGGS